MLRQQFPESLLHEDVMLTTANGAIIGAVNLIMVGWVILTDHKRDEDTWVSVDEIITIVTDPETIAFNKAEEIQNETIAKLSHRRTNLAIPGAEKQIAEQEKQAKIPEAERDTGPTMPGFPFMVMQFPTDPTENTGTAESIDEWFRTGGSTTDQDEGTDL